MSESVESLKETIAQLEKELESYKELSSSLAKENAQITELVKNYLSVVNSLFPERNIVLPE